jgi:cephalosporin hydroxylase
MLRHIARNILPAPVRRRFRVALNVPDEWLRRVAVNVPNKWLNQVAVRRVRDAMYVQTTDAITVRWLGRQIWQYPLDAWNMQEMIADLKPDLIVETGTYRGGSAFFLASLCDLMAHGEVITIDVAARETIPHPRITYLQGSSIDPTIVNTVTQRMRAIQVRRALIILDSDHSARHVRQELEAYAPLVPVDSYMHVQDGDIDELPRLRKYRPGPRVAAAAFLQDHPEFVRDTVVEFRYMMTAHPYGWLKRIPLRQ